ncbi:MAG: hypothetical protein ACREYF_22770 [Gammaproteobacteria bacterium]
MITRTIEQRKVNVTRLLRSDHELAGPLQLSSVGSRTGASDLCVESGSLVRVCTWPGFEHGSKPTYGRRPSIFSPPEATQT